MLAFLLTGGLSTVIGIDLGQDTIKVSYGSYNQAIKVARNSQSSYSTPNVFALWNQDNRMKYPSIIPDNNQLRWAFGQEAVDECDKHPENCIGGVNPDKSTYKSAHGYEIMALALLKLLSEISESERLSDEITVVISIPPSASIVDKSYLYNALSIAGIKCVQFITSTASVAELYANERYRKGSETVAFLDIGQGGVRISSFEFSNNEIRQVHEEYNNKIGVNSVDFKLAKILADKYRYIDVSSPKKQQKFLQEIKIAKEKLSVMNSYSFEHDDRKITLTKNDLERATKEMIDQIIKMAKSTYSIRRFSKIELIGQGSRIPFIQKTLQKYFTVSRSLDAETAVCLGAGYTAALHTNEVKVKDMKRHFLISSPFTLKSNGKQYRVFTKDDFDEVEKSVLLPDHATFHIVDDESLDIFWNCHIENPVSRYGSQVEITMQMNNYLMPVIISANEVYNRQSYEAKIAYEYIGWEITPNEMESAKQLVTQMINSVNNRRTKEKLLNDIEKRILDINKFLKGDNGLNWWDRFWLKRISSKIADWYNSIIDFKDVTYNEILKKLNDLIDQTAAFLDRQEFRDL